MEKGFLFGMIVALLLVALLASSGAVEYLYDNVEMGTSAVSGVAAPTALSDGATKGYVDAAATLGCTWKVVGIAFCSGNHCFANKPTADKVCQDKGYQYASTFTFYGSPTGYVTTSWIGSGWQNATYSDEDAGYGGGGLGSGAWGSIYISYALCCE